MKSVHVKGRISNPRHIELDEAVTDLSGPVEVVLRPMLPKGSTRDVFAFIASLKPGKRSKGELDKQLAEERDA